MKRTVFLLLCVLIHVNNSYSQIINDLYGKTNNKFIFEKLSKCEVGENLFLGRSIEAENFKFSMSPFSMEVDSTNQKIVIQLRKMNKDYTKYKDQGFYSVHGLNLEERLWSRPLNYSVNEIRLLPNSLLEFFDANNGTHISSYGLSTGSLNWKITTSFSSMGLELFYISESQPIGIGWDYKTLKAINLIDGKEIWSKKIKNRDSGVSHCFFVDNSNLLLLSGGIHWINLEEGIKWSYKIKTSARSYDAQQRLGNLLNGGLATGLMALTLGANKNITTDLDIDIKDGLIYFSNNEESIILDANNGELIESKPQGKSEKEIIEEDDSTEIQDLVYDEFRFKNVGNSLEVFNSKNIKIATLNISSILLFNNHYLYGASKDYLYKIDLKQLTN